MDNINLTLLTKNPVLIIPTKNSQNQECPNKIMALCYDSAENNQIHTISTSFNIPSLNNIFFIKMILNNSTSNIIICKSLDLKSENYKNYLFNIFQDINNPENIYINPLLYPNNYLKFNDIFNYEPYNFIVELDDYCPLNSADEAFWNIETDFNDSTIIKFFSKKGRTGNLTFIPNQSSIEPYKILGKNSTQSIDISNACVLSLTKYEGTIQQGYSIPSSTWHIVDSKNHYLLSYNNNILNQSNIKINLPILNSTINATLTFPYELPFISSSSCSSSSFLVSVISFIFFMLLIIILILIIF